MKLIHFGLISALFCTLILASTDSEKKGERRFAAIRSSKLKPAIYVKQDNSKNRHIANY